jgi:hypothetical protein
MIHHVADEKNVVTSPKEEAVVDINVPDPKWGLSGLAETRKQDFPD